jgi:hypothetical protein
MANFCSKEGTLLANTAQSFNFDSLIGSTGAQSLVYKNDDGAKDHILQIDGGQSVFTVKANEQRVVTGLSDATVLTIGGDANSTGPYRLAVSTELEPPIIKY